MLQTQAEMGSGAAVIRTAKQFTNPTWAVFETPLKALFGQQQGSFQALLWLQLLFLKVQLYKQVTVGMCIYITSSFPQQGPIHSLW